MPPDEECVLNADDISLVFEGSNGEASSLKINDVCAPTSISLACSAYEGSEKSADDSSDRQNAISKSITAASNFSSKIGRAHV